MIHTKKSCISSLIVPDQQELDNKTNQVSTKVYIDPSERKPFEFCPKGKYKCTHENILNNHMLIHKGKMHLYVVLLR